MPWVYVLINKTGFMQNNHETLCKPIIEQVAQIILQEFVELNVVCFSGKDFTDLEGGFFVDVDE